MRSQYTRPYFDSNVFIAWIQGEIAPDGTDRKRIADHILEGAKKLAYQIYTSAFTLAEVHKLPDGGRVLTEEEDTRILAFFEHSYIQLVDVDRGIGEEANRFCRLYGLSAGDAVHLACAVRAECDVLLTWDEDFIRKAQRAPVIVEKPQILGQLPMPEPAGSMTSLFDSQPFRSQ